MTTRLVCSLYRLVCSLVYLVAEIIPVSVSLGDYDNICVKRNAVNICTDHEP